jgi:hypothetical protein
VLFSDAPMYFADALITQQDLPWDPRSVVAAENINQHLPADREFSIAGMRQKLNFLSERLLLAWAGSEHQARQLFRVLMELERDDCLTMENIEQVIEGAPFESFDELSIIGTLMTPDQEGGGVTITQFDFNVKIADLKRHEGSVTAYGTGAKRFFAVLPDLLQPIHVQEEKFIKAEQLAAGLIGTFFPHEIMTGGHLLEWWGGAFEIATFDNGSIRKRSNVLFTLWRLIPNIDGSYQLALAPRFIKQHYFDDALIVQDLKVVIQGNGCIGMPTLSVHTVLPLLKNEPDYDFSMLQLGDFSHTMLCVYVLPIDGAECDEVFTKIISDDAGVRNIQLAVDTNSVKIGVEGSFVSELAGC